MLLAPFATERLGFRGFVAVYAAAALAWVPLLRRQLPLALVVVIALVLRVPFLFHEPRLSGDVYRYLSDGRVFAEGGNPYTYTPTDPRVNHPEIRSIYPPHAQWVFRFVPGLTPWRLVLIAADLAVIVLLRKRGALAYATCPLVLVEGTWNAHIDALAAALLLVALLRNSGAAAALAGGMKIIPFAAIPVLLRKAPLTARRVLAFLAALAIPVIPFLGAPIMPGFREYATRWIFNSPLYELVRMLVQRVDTKLIWTHHPLRFEAISDVVYRYLYPDFLTRAILGVIAVTAILSARKVTTAIAALLICSPAIHPWYWVTLVPTALVERSGWVWVAVAAPVSYLLYEGAPPLLVMAACYALPAIAIFVERGRPAR
jgi:hypothetical protein